MIKKKEQRLLYYAIAICDLHVGKVPGQVGIVPKAAPLEVAMVSNLQVGTIMATVSTLHIDTMVAIVTEPHTSTIVAITERALVSIEHRKIDFVV